MVPLGEHIVHCPNVAREPNLLLLFFWNTGNHYKAAASRYRYLVPVLLGAIN